MNTPDSIKSHAGDYQTESWRDYTLLELGAWVHLLAKRALHRSDPEKARKDMYDANNYLNMMGARLDETEEELDEAFSDY